MSNVIRVALPGYNAETDTNLDHFALYTDQDNVLIKEFQRGTISLASGASQDITHNLGYIPFFLVFVNDTSYNASTWLLLGIPPILSAQYYCASDTTKLTIVNNTSPGITINFTYFIFYDNAVGSSGITLTESNEVFKVTKSGFNALTEKDPNNMIFHSDLNTFKILYQGTQDLAITIGTPTYQFAHNSPISSASCIIIFAKFPDGKVAFLSAIYATLSGDRAKSLQQAYFDNTNIYINYGFVAANYTLHLSWYVFDASL